MCYRCLIRPRRTIVAGVDKVGARTCDPCSNRMRQQKARAIELGNCSRCLVRPAKQGRRTCQSCLDKRAHYMQKVRRAATAAVAPAPTATEKSRGEDDAAEGPCKAQVAGSKNGLWKMMIVYILNS